MMMIMIILITMIIIIMIILTYLTFAKTFLRFYLPNYDHTDKEGSQYSQKILIFSNILTYHGSKSEIRH